MSGRTLSLSLLVSFSILVLAFPGQAKAGDDEGRDWEKHQKKWIEKQQKAEKKDYKAWRESEEKWYKWQQRGTRKAYREWREAHEEWLEKRHERGERVHGDLPHYSPAIERRRPF